MQPAGSAFLIIIKNTGSLKARLEAGVQTKAASGFSESCRPWVLAAMLSLTSVRNPWLKAVRAPSPGWFFRSGGSQGWACHISGRFTTENWPLDIVNGTWSGKWRERCILKWPFWAPTEPEVPYQSKQSAKLAMGIKKILRQECIPNTPVALPGLLNNDLVYGTQGRTTGYAGCLGATME